MTNPTILLAPLFTLLATAGCANGPDDALTGTWTNAACFGSTTMPADIQTCSVQLTFAADLTVSVVDARQSQPATAVYPRCTTTRRVTGPRYSTSNASDSRMTVTITGSSMSTVERAGCANPDDNLAATADQMDSIPIGVMPFQLGANTLTIATGLLEGSYSR